MSKKPKKLVMLEKSLRFLTRLILAKYRPKIIAITGSIGKTSAKEAIYAVLSPHFSVRTNQKNYNNEIGIPLTIIGSETGGSSIFRWFYIYLKAKAVILFPTKYSKVLVLEMGADQPGDIKYLVSFARPEISVITEISGSHLEFFKTVEGVAKEKSQLAKCLDEKGLAILNADNPLVADIKKHVKSRVVTYGFSKEADIRASDPAINYSSDDSNEIRGISFKIARKGTFIPVRLNHVLARHQIYAALAAVAVGLEMRINLVDIAKALENFRSPAGRMTLVPGIKKSYIIDDTYNASPASTLAALSVLGEARAVRKIAVLGDMLEQGSGTEAGHREVARKFLEVGGHIFIAVGDRMNFAVEELKKNGFIPANIFHFSHPTEAGRKLQELIRPGDLALVKGSQGLRMEKVVEEVMNEPLKAAETLCRQNPEWKQKPFIEV